MSLLRLDNVSKRYRPEDAPAVEDVSFEVGGDEVFALVGPSGCGKTTTLRIIAGLEPADSGCVRLGDRLVEGPGVHLGPEKRRIGLVFQELALFPHLDVLGNVSFGLHEMPRRQRRDRALEALRMVGIEDLAHRKPHELSGGQQQRVALARSIAPAPRIILLDEPFANLDADLRQEMRREVKRVLKDNGMSALLVTHDQEEALSFADRVGVMRSGRLLQTGPPQEVYTRPACPFVAQFLGRTNLIRAAATGEHAETPFGSMCLDCRASGSVLLSVRPEHLRLVPPREGEPVGRVVSREFKGHDLTLHVECGERTYTVQTDYTCPFRVGDPVGIIHAEPAVVVEHENGSTS